MNLYASKRPLLIGIGNPLRGDDGLGRAVAEQLARETGDTGIDCDIHTVHQLTPELAEVMAKANLAVLIDASRQGEAGELRIRLLSPCTRPGAVGMHHMTPEELATLTAALYGQCPPIIMVSLTGADFGIGEHLSAIVAQKISSVSATVKQYMLTVLPEAPLFLSRKSSAPTAADIF